MQPAQFDTMRRAELDTVIGWAADEGWNPGPDDAAAFHTADPYGFFVARAGGRLAAAISVVNHSDSFAFLGLYICHPDFRGQGIGYALWRHALAHAGTRTIGLDGVPDQQDNYRCSGFVLADETLRWSGRVEPQPENSSEPALHPVRPADIPALTALEAAANGYAKPAFLAAWLTDTPTRRTLVLRSDGSPDGFVTLRRCREGSKIGPLIAPDLAAARSLIHGAAALAEEGPLIIDVPASCAALTGYCRSLGLTPAFNTARMYRGAAPQPGPHIRAIATLELG